MRETAASLALAARSPTRRAARAVGPHRERDRGRPGARRAAVARRRRARGAARPADARRVGRAGCRSRPRSRSWCSPRRSCSLNGRLDRLASRPDRDGRGVRPRREGRRRARGRARSRTRARRSRASCSCPTAPATSAATTSTPLAADKTYQLWAVTGSETTPTVVSAGVLGPEPSARRLPRQRPGARVRGDRRGRGRRGGVAAEAGRAGSR